MFATYFFQHKSLNILCDFNLYCFCHFSKLQSYVVGSARELEMDRNGVVPGQRVGHMILS